MRHDYFVTGTDTGVGKTLVTAALLRHLRESGLRVAGMKPVAAGAIAGPEGPANPDALLLQSESSVRHPYATVNPCLFTPAIAARGLVLAGWIANCFDPDFARPEANVAALTARLAAPYRGIVPWMPVPDLSRAAAALADAARTFCIPLE